MENQQPRVLIVENNPEHQEVLAAQLAAAGYVPVPVRDGRQALDLLATEHFVMMLLDMELWDTSSYQVLERLNTDGHLPTLPVLMIVSTEHTPEIERGLALGAVDYIAEPFNPAVVRQRLNACEMQRQLDTTLQDALRKEELLKIERDVQIARQIQEGFLPDQLPQAAGWEIAACFHPARNVAGDFYDAFMLSQNRRIGFLIADVCDKGVGAALFMSLSRSLIRSFAQVHQTLGWTDVLSSETTLPSARRTSRDPAKKAARIKPSVGVTALKNTVTHVNNYITDNHIEMNMFVTLFFGVLDPVTGTLNYVNGGHVPPVIIHPDGSTETLPITGPAVGMMPGVQFAVEETQLNPGDKLFCYTDGVTDARAPNREFFGDERVQTLLTQSAPSAQALLDRIEARLHAHIANAEQFDDITMLAVHRLNPA
jgi:sigma-B regulation protein RsbU (phosphoserine phosphatase)